MPMSTRELYLVLRARDEASRTLRGLSRELLATGAAAQAAAVRTQAGIQRETAARARREAQMARDLSARYRSIAAQTREQATLARMNGTNNATIQQLRTRAIQYDRLARQQEAVARGHDRTARAALAEAQAMEQNARAADEVAQRHRHMISIVDQAGQAMATAGVGMIAAGVVGVGMIKDLVDVSVEYERQVRHTATQIDGFKGNLQQLGDIGRKVAHDFAVPFQEIQPALFDIFSSTDATVAQAEMLLRSFSKAAVAGQVDIQDTSRATIGILNAFSLPLEDVNKVLDIQFQLVKEGVGDYSEWAQKIGLVSPSAARAGQSLEVMTAALATATRMGMTAARASTSVARAMDAMSNPKVIANLEKMGVKSLDAAGHMRPMNDILRDFRDVLMKMPEKDRVGTILDVFKGAGGTIEARRFLQTMLLVPGTLEQFDTILGNIKDSAGTLDQAYGVMADSAAAKTQLLQNKWMLLKESMGKALTPSFIVIVTWVSKLLDKFNELSPKVKSWIAVVFSASSILGIVGGIILTIVGALAAFIAAVASAGTVLLPIIAIIVGLVVGIGAMAVAFKTLYDHSDSFKAFIGGSIDILKRLWEIAKGFAKDLRDSWDKYVNPAIARFAQYLNDNVLPAFNTFRNEIAGKIIPALQEFADNASKVADTLFKYLGYAIDWILGAVKDLNQTWVDNRDKIMPLIEILIQVAKWFGIIAVVISGVVVIALGSILVGAIYLVIKVISWLISIVSLSVDAWHATVAAIKAVWTWMGLMVSAAKDGVSNFLGHVLTLPGKIQNAVSGFGTLLIHAGESLLAGLIQGVKNMMGPLENALSAVTNFISKHKGPPEKDAVLLVPAGVKIMQGLMKGIASQMPDLQNQLEGITADVKVTGSRAGDDYTFRKPDISPTSSGGGQVVKNYYITQNITTQEISPIRQAADLGWEVTTVM